MRIKSISEINLSLPRAYKKHLGNTEKVLFNRMVNGYLNTEMKLYQCCQMESLRVNVCIQSEGGHGI